MAWVRHDDRYDDTRKIKRAWRRNRASVGLHAMATTYCARHETNGLVDLDWLEDKLPKDRERTEVIAVMTNVGLFELLPAGETREVVVREHKITYGPSDEDAYIVKDFLEFNESSVEAALRRAKEAQRKADARARKSGGSPGGQTPDSGSSAAGRRKVSLLSRPDPTRPDPTIAPQPPASGGRDRDWDRYRESMDQWAAATPPTPEDAARMDALRVALPDDRWACMLHAHGSPNGRLVIGTGHRVNKGSTDPTSWVRDRYSQTIEVEVGEYELVPCGCEVES